MHRSLILTSLLCASVVYSEDLSDCTAFSSNGLAAAQYQYYRLYDFRHMNLENIRDSSSNGTRSKIVTGSTWKNDWYIRDYPRKSPGGTSIPVDFTPQKVYISNETDPKQNYTSYLSFNTERVSPETQYAGEITYQEFNASYASIRVYARVHGAPGAVAGIFTYLNDTEESDIEMFTRAPAEYIQYSNQPASLGAPTWADIPGATVNDTMPNENLYTDWHVHRLDWTPERSVFFVDDVQTNTTNLHVPVSDPPSGIYVDMWSANSTWSGSMDVGKNATLDVQWIELLFNVTNPPKTASTQRICAIGSENSVQPSTSRAIAAQIPLRMRLFVWTVMIGVVVVV